MVSVNFSVSSQGNATWVILATTNTRRRFYLLYVEERISQRFLHLLNSKVIRQYQIELFGTEVDLSRHKHHTYKDHVYLDRLFLLSNLTWRRAHAMAALTGRDSDVKLNVLRRFL